jgi:hypothetical protein
VVWVGARLGYQQASAQGLVNASCSPSYPDGDLEQPTGLQASGKGGSRRDHA